MPEKLEISTSMLRRTEDLVAQAMHVGRTAVPPPGPSPSVSNSAPRAPRPPQHPPPVLPPSALYAETHGRRTSNSSSDASLEDAPVSRSLTRVAPAPLATEASLPFSPDSPGKSPRRARENVDWDVRSPGSVALSTTKSQATPASRVLFTPRSVTGGPDPALMTARSKVSFKGGSVVPLDDDGIADNFALMADPIDEKMSELLSHPAQTTEPVTFTESKVRGRKGKPAGPAPKPWETDGQRRLRSVKSMKDAAVAGADAKAIGPVLLLRQAVRQLLEIDTTTGKVQSLFQQEYRAALLAQGPDRGPTAQRTAKSLGVAETHDSRGNVVDRYFASKRHAMASDAATERHRRARSTSVSVHPLSDDAVGHNEQHQQLPAVSMVDSGTGGHSSGGSSALQSARVDAPVSPRASTSMTESEDTRIVREVESQELKEARRVQRAAENEKHVLHETEIRDSATDALRLLQRQQDGLLGAKQRSEMTDQDRSWKAGLTPIEQQKLMLTGLSPMAATAVRTTGAAQVSPAPTTGTLPALTPRSQQQGHPQHAGGSTSPGRGHGSHQGGPNGPRSGERPAPFLDEGTAALLADLHREVADLRSLHRTSEAERQKQQTQLLDVNLRLRDAHQEIRDLKGLLSKAEQAANQAAAGQARTQGELEHLHGELAAAESQKQRDFAMRRRNETQTEEKLAEVKSEMAALYSQARNAEVKHQMMEKEVTGITQDRDDTVAKVTKVEIERDQLEEIVRLRDVKIQQLEDDATDRRRFLDSLSRTVQELMLFVGRVSLTDLLSNPIITSDVPPARRLGNAGAAGNSMTLQQSSQAPPLGLVPLQLTPVASSPLGVDSSLPPKLVDFETGTVREHDNVTSAPEVQGSVATKVRNGSSSPPDSDTVPWFVPAAFAAGAAFVLGQQQQRLQKWEAKQAALTSPKGRDGSKQQSAQLGADVASRPPAGPAFLLALTTVPGSQAQGPGALTVAFPQLACNGDGGSAVEYHGAGFFPGLLVNPRMVPALATLTASSLNLSMTGAVPQTPRPGTSDLPGRVTPKPPTSARGRRNSKVSFPPGTLDLTPPSSRSQLTSAGGQPTAGGGTGPNAWQTDPVLVAPHVQKASIAVMPLKDGTVWKEWFAGHAARRRVSGLPAPALWAAAISMCEKHVETFSLSVDHKLSWQQTRTPVTFQFRGDWWYAAIHATAGLVTCPVSSGRRKDQAVSMATALPGTFSSVFSNVFPAAEFSPTRSVAAPTSPGGAQEKAPTEDGAGRPLAPSQLGWPSSHLAAVSFAPAVFAAVPGTPIGRSMRHEWIHGLRSTDVRAPIDPPLAAVAFQPASTQHAVIAAASPLKNLPGLRGGQQQSSTQSPGVSTTTQPSPAMQPSTSKTSVPPLTDAALEAVGQPTGSRQGMSTPTDTARVTAGVSLPVSAPGTPGTSVAATPGNTPSKAPGSMSLPDRLAPYETPGFWRWSEIARAAVLRPRFTLDDVIRVSLFEAARGPVRFVVPPGCDRRMADQITPRLGLPLSSTVGIHTGADGLATAVSSARPLPPQMPSRWEIARLAAAVLHARYLDVRSASSTPHDAVRMPLSVDPSITKPSRCARPAHANVAAMAKSASSTDNFVGVPTGDMTAEASVLSASGDEAMPWLSPSGQSLEQDEAAPTASGLAPFPLMLKPFPVFVRDFFARRGAPAVTPAPDTVTAATSTPESWHEARRMYCGNPRDDIAAIVAEGAQDQALESAAEISGSGVTKGKAQGPAAKSGRKPSTASAATAAAEAAAAAFPTDAASVPPLPSPMIELMAALHVGAGQQATQCGGHCDMDTLLFHLVAKGLIPEQLVVDLLSNLDHVYASAVAAAVAASTNDDNSDAAGVASSAAAGAHFDKVAATTPQIGRGFGFDDEPTKAGAASRDGLPLQVPLPALAAIVKDQGFVVTVARTTHVVPSKHTGDARTAVPDAPTSTRRLPFTTLEMVRIVAAVTEDQPTGGAQVTLDTLLHTPTAAFADTTGAVLRAHHHHLQTSASAAAGAGAAGAGVQYDGESLTPLMVQAGFPVPSVVRSRFFEEYCRVVLDRFERDRQSLFKDVFFRSTPLGEHAKAWVSEQARGQAEQAAAALKASMPTKSRPGTRDRPVRAPSPGGDSDDTATPTPRAAQRGGGNKRPDSATVPPPFLPAHDASQTGQATPLHALVHPHIDLRPPQMAGTAATLSPQELAIAAVAAAGPCAPHLPTHPAATPPPSRPVSPAVQALPHDHGSVLVPPTTELAGPQMTLDDARRAWQQRDASAAPTHIDQLLYILTRPLTGAHVAPSGSASEELASQAQAPQSAPHAHHATKRSFPLAVFGMNAADASHFDAWAHAAQEKRAGRRIVGPAAGPSVAPDATGPELKNVKGRMRPLQQYLNNAQDEWFDILLVHTCLPPPAPPATALRTCHSGNTGSGSYREEHTATMVPSGATEPAPREDKSIESQRRHFGCAPLPSDDVEGTAGRQPRCWTEREVCAAYRRYDTALSDLPTVGKDLPVSAAAREKARHDLQAELSVAALLPRPSEKHTESPTQGAAQRPTERTQKLQRHTAAFAPLLPDVAPLRHVLWRAARLYTGVFDFSAGSADDDGSEASTTLAAVLHEAGCNEPSGATRCESESSGKGNLTAENMQRPSVDGSAHGRPAPVSPGLLSLQDNASFNARSSSLANSARQSDLVLGSPDAVHNTITAAPQGGVVLAAIERVVSLGLYTNADPMAWRRFAVKTLVLRELWDSALNPSQAVLSALRELGALRGPAGTARPSIIPVSAPALGGPAPSLAKQRKSLAGMQRVGRATSEAGRQRDAGGDSNMFELALEYRCSMQPAVLPPKATAILAGVVQELSRTAYSVVIGRSHAGVDRRMLLPPRATMTTAQVVEQEAHPPPSAPKPHDEGRDKEKDRERAKERDAERDRERERLQSALVSPLSARNAPSGLATFFHAAVAAQGAQGKDQLPCCPPPLFLSNEQL